MAATVSITINFRDGSSQTISHPAGKDNDIVQYSQLAKSFDYLQEHSNNILTTLVNQEKTQKNDAGSSVDGGCVDSNGNDKLNVNSNNNGNENDGTDDDDSEDDDDDNTNNPPEKKRKT